MKKKYLDFTSLYNTSPFTIAKGVTYQGYEEIIMQVKKNINKEKFVLALDLYPGVDEERIIEAFSILNPSKIIKTIDLFKDKEVINKQIKCNLTDDRVFGHMYYGEIMDFLDLPKLDKAIKTVQKNKGFTLIIGFGAALFSESDLNILFDITRWEIQLRYRKGMSNYKNDNFDEDILKKYKRGFFIEWRIADKHKIKNIHSFSYIVDANNRQMPKMISLVDFMHGLYGITQTPFRTVPYFDQGVWGGQWMKEGCNLDTQAKNYAWSFDGVPEENAILLNFDGVILEFPALDVVLLYPKELLGEMVYARYGAEFPIRFDLIDTFEGANLSLQVHPITEYIKKTFGMTYTQDESYYIVDTIDKDGGYVYLGLKEGINEEEMIAELEEAQKGTVPFDVEKYINKWPAKKHDHFLIPAGTIHCNGSGAFVLEISSTPYIFTFKLWDWGRLGLDGLPRPVHINHGKEVIQWDRTTSWVKSNLINAIERIKEDENQIIEHTGLHAFEPIESERYFIKGLTYHETKNNVQMLNLVEGKEIIIESPSNQFKPFLVHYAETFVVPASVKEYTMRPYGRSENETCIIMKAYVRF